MELWIPKLSRPGDMLIRTSFVLVVCHLALGLSTGNRPSYTVRCDLQWRESHDLDRDVYISTSHQTLDLDSQHDPRFADFSDNGIIYEQAIVCDPALYFYNHSLTNVSFVDRKEAVAIWETVPVTITMLNMTCLNILKDTGTMMHSINPTNFTLLQSFGMRCDIGNLPDGYLHNMFNLLILDLTGNNITYLYKDMFIGVPNLMILMLSDNPIGSYDSGVFCPFFRLYSIDIQGSFDAYPIELSFKHANSSCNPFSYSSLVRLSRNNFQQMEANSFTGFTNLNNELQLAGCGIKELHEDTFSGLSDLLYMLMDDNNISQLPPNVYSPLTSIRDISLANNQLTSVPKDLLAKSKRIKDIRFDNNHFLTWNGFYPAVNSLLLLALGRNRLTNLVADMFVSTPNLQWILVEENKISTISMHTFSGLDNIGFINLSSNSLTDLPTGVFNGLQHLIYLDLSKNRIHHISHYLLDDNPSISYLFLSDNKLQTIDAEFIIYPRGAVISTISLHGNPFKCDCNLEPFRVWMQNFSDKIDTPDQIYCKYGQSSDTNATRLINAPSFCESSLGHTSISNTLVIISSVLGVFVALSLLIILIYVFKHDLTVILFARYNINCKLYRDDAKEKDKLFDAFISHSSADVEFVLNFIMPKLEREENFKLCVHFRDFLIGEPIALNISRAIEESRMTLILLSRNFLESEWCKYEFQIAHHELLSQGGRKVILVLLEDIGTSEMDQQLRSYIRTHTYLKKDDRLFWEKLIYALPHKQSKTATCSIV